MLGCYIYNLRSGVLFLEESFFGGTRKSARAMIAGDYIYDVPVLKDKRNCRPLTIWAPDHGCLYRLYVVLALYFTHVTHSAFHVCSRTGSDDAVQLTVPLYISERNSLRENLWKHTC